MLAGAATVVGAGCGGSKQASQSAPPASMSDLEVSLDPSGRPYDEALRAGATVTTEHLTTLTLPRGKAVITDGIMLAWLDAEQVGSVVDLGDGERYPVDVVWLTDADGYRSVAGLVIVVSDAPVAKWSAFESAYGTDGGLGVITSVDYLAVNGHRSDDDQERAANDWLDRLGDKPLLTDDLDSVPGTDTILFSNGFGDGGFPMSRGLDRDGELARLAIWHLIAPWRLAFPDGRPPPDVTDREHELAACLDGGTIPGGAGCTIASGSDG